MGKSCERCEVVYFGPKCVVFNGPHRFCHTCGRNKSTHPKAPQLRVIKGGTTMRDEIERLAALLETAEEQATEQSGQMEARHRSAYELGFVAQRAKHVAGCLRRLLRAEHDLAAERDASDPSAVRL